MVILLSLHFRMKSFSRRREDIKNIGKIAQTFTINRISYKSPGISVLNWPLINFIPQFEFYPSYKA